ncbi:MAG TPA: hypothetical protein VMU01_11140, partial [Rhizomicrobium sp.]|nr:hypothetical protein [Rhizomicrobium sp.]
FNHPAGTRYDHLSLVTAPFTMTRGGYVITMKNGRVHQHFGSEEKRERFRKEDRRLHRSEYRRLEQAGQGRGRQVA